MARDPYPFARVPIRISANRSGTRNAGVEGNCGGGSGGCDTAGGCGGGNPPCTPTGAIDAEAILSFSRRTGRLNAASNMWGLKVPPDQTPDCDVEQWDGRDWHLVDADLIKRSDPKIAGDAKKFIVQETRTKSRDLGGGKATAKIRWVITFRRLN